MVYCSSNNMSTQNEEVESLLMSPCWNQTVNGTDHYLLEGHKLLLEHDLDSLPGSDSETQKSSMDVLDSLLNSTSNISTSNTNLAELKPLPPFTGYTGHLSINGISGHHYHAIAQRLPEENNNYSQSSYSPTNGSGEVSSSTCLPDSVLMAEADTPLSDVKLFSDNSIDSKTYLADSCVMSTGPDSVSGGKILLDSKDLGEYDMSSIDDIAAIIGSAIADTTVPGNRVENEESDTRDSWMDLDAWIEGTCGPQDTKLIVSNQDSLNEYILPNHSPLHSSGSTLQSLLTHGYMPLLQNRLQNGPPIKIEAPSSTSYCGELISTSTSPPGSVCSTTDNIMLNGRFLQNGQHHYQLTLNSLKPDGLCSPDLLSSYPHTTSTTTSTKNKRPRTHNKKQQQQQQIQQQQQQQQISVSQAAVSFQTANDLSGLLGKEKPVHRCNICNRGFLNKSNIKVHLRTHTGEKPFRCEVCAKAFRQKAHLIKHQQIHKRIGRD
ncbi:ichor [Culicoides brevitarsis]|uniref:ichor n=1 Tax=Culicoides brevitarsis TaxID=469753 RepID=UPI00307C1237